MARYTTGLFQAGTDYRLAGTDGPGRPARLPSQGLLRRRSFFTSTSPLDTRVQTRWQEKTKDEVKVDKESAEKEQTAEEPVEEIKDDKTTSEEEKG